MDLTVITSTNFELLRYYVIPALSFLALFLIFVYVIFEKGES